jgi:hypothetical protein
MGRYQGILYTLWDLRQAIGHLHHLLRVREACITPATHHRTGSHRSKSYGLPHPPRQRLPSSSPVKITAGKKL